MIVLFVVCTFINVITGTIKSLMTVKGGNISAAIWNAINAGLYSFIVVLTATADMPTAGKVIITIIANLIGVYLIKLLEEKLRKDRLWKLEMTVLVADADAMHEALEWAKIPNHYVKAGRHAVFSCFCETKQQTQDAITVGASYGAKYFASETTLTP